MRQPFVHLPIIRGRIPFGQCAIVGVMSESLPTRARVHTSTGVHDQEGRAVVVYDAAVVARAALSHTDVARVILYYSTLPQQVTGEQWRSYQWHKDNARFSNNTGTGWRPQIRQISPTALSSADDNRDTRTMRRNVGSSREKLQEHLGAAWRDCLEKESRK
ncbi:hypothetical protein J6590_002066 [Homalodisca vitripennis]|nr:hypothetical protein J6590_002066 [Homalodisca vitripennis]